MPFVTITNCSRGNFTLSHPFGSLKLGASKTANITDKQLHSMSAKLQNLEKSGFISIFIGSEKPKVVVTVEIPKVAVSVVEAVVEPVVEAVVEPVVEAVVEPVVTNESVVSPKFVLGPDLKIIEVHSDSKTRKRR
jgi:hypothetical protein